ncbi:Histone H4.1 [Yarrowia sp. C11]|nr:Histone H4.1 [Yarrowia sp. E02]KAG5371746.1 Histone H4.1 [Yarrowia sp. C11]
MAPRDTPKRSLVAKAQRRASVQRGSKVPRNYRDLEEAQLAIRPLTRGTNIRTSRVTRAQARAAAQAEAEAGVAVAGVAAAAQEVPASAMNEPQASSSRVKSGSQPIAGVHSSSSDDADYFDASDGFDDTSDGSSMSDVVSEGELEDEDEDEDEDTAQVPGEESTPAMVPPPLRPVEVSESDSDSSDSSSDSSDSSSGSSSDGVEAESNVPANNISSSLEDDDSESDEDEPETITIDDDETDSVPTEEAAQPGESRPSSSESTASSSSSSSPPRPKSRNKYALRLEREVRALQADSGRSNTKNFNPRSKPGKDTGNGKVVVKGSGRGKGAKGLGVVGPLRHRKVLRDSISGVTKPAIRRLARRGGVKRIGTEIYGIIREVTKETLTSYIGTGVVYTIHSKRQTMVTEDAVRAVKRHGRSLYGFS